MSIDRYEKFHGQRPRRLRHLLATTFAVQTYRALYGVTTQLQFRHDSNARQRKFTFCNRNKMRWNVRDFLKSISKRISHQLYSLLKTQVQYFKHSKIPEFEHYWCYGFTKNSLQSYSYVWAVMNAFNSRFWVPDCVPCFPAIFDHLSWATTFVWHAEGSLYAGFTVVEIYGRKLTINTYRKIMKSVSFSIGRSKDSRQVRFFLVNALYFYKTPGSLKLHFYHVDKHHHHFRHRHCHCHRQCQHRRLNRRRLRLCHRGLGCRRWRRSRHNQYHY